MIVELTRFRVKPGMSHKVDEWLKFLNDNMEGVLLTLEREKMYVETIFREKCDDEEYLYWYSVQGENGIRVEESDSWIDKKHLEYWDECIDKNYYVEMSMQVSMISNHIANLMTDNSIVR